MTRLGWLDIVEYNGKSGTYSDGDIWVGYSRKTYQKDPRGSEYILKFKAPDVSQMCNAQGKAY